MAESRSAGGIAEGNIFPCRIVKLGATRGGIAQAVATDRPIGISFKDTRRSQYVDTTGYLATANEPVSYYTDGARCMLELAATVAVGNRLVASSDGRGNPTTSTASPIVGIAEDAGAAGDIIPVRIQIGDAV
jgi:hypothetical protein